MAGESTKAKVQEAKALLGSEAKLPAGNRADTVQRNLKRITLQKLNMLGEVWQGDDVLHPVPDVPCTDEDKTVATSSSRREMPRAAAAQTRPKFEKPAEGEGVKGYPLKFKGDPPADGDASTANKKKTDQTDLEVAETVAGATEEAGSATPVHKVKDSSESGVVEPVQVKEEPTELGDTDSDPAFKDVLITLESGAQLAQRYHGILVADHFRSKEYMCNFAEQNIPDIEDERQMSKARLKWLRMSTAADQFFGSFKGAITSMQKYLKKEDDKVLTEERKRRKLAEKTSCRTRRRTWTSVRSSSRTLRQPAPLSFARRLPVIKSRIQE